LALAPRPPLRYAVVRIATEEVFPPPRDRAGPGGLVIRRGPFRNLPHAPFSAYWRTRAYA